MSPLSGGAGDGGGDWALPPESSVRCDRRSHHRLPTTRLCGVPRLRTAGVWTRVLRHPSLSTTLQAALSAIPADRYRSALAMLRLRRLLRPRQNDRVSRRIKSQRSSDKPAGDNALLHRARDPKFCRRVASAPRLQGRNHSLISRPVMNACGSRHPAMTNAIKEIISTM
jgi:hypothetical protein